MQDFAVPGPAGHMLLFELVSVTSPEAGSHAESCAGCGVEICTEVPTLTVDRCPHGYGASPAQIHQLEYVAPSRGETGRVSAAR